MKHSVAKPITPGSIKTISQIEFSDGASYESSRVENLHLSGITARSISLDGVVLEACEISSSKLRKATFTDSLLNNCMLFASDFDGSGWQRIEVEKGMMSGIVLSDASLKDVVFKDVKINLSNFRFSNLERVKFDGCDLTEADFQEAELKNAVFSNCDMSGVDFSKSKMKNVDLRSSQLVEMKGLHGLRGAVISSTQLFELAHDLAGELGIKVSDD